MSQVLLSARSHLPTALVLALGSRALAACDPFIATVGVLPESPMPMDAGLDSDRPQPEEDAGPDADPSGEPRDSGGPKPRIDCITLIDQKEEAGRTADGGVIDGHTIEELHCSPLDAGKQMEPPTSSIFERFDGEPLLESGKTYSFRWPMSGLRGLRLYGGDRACSTTPIYQEASLLTLAAPACRAFVAPADITFLRMSGGELLWTLPIGKKYAEFLLCRADCDDNP